MLCSVAPVLLEQVEEGSPCVLTLSCRTASSVAIRSLTVVSEARTMEVYNQLEEYCGTVRGLKDESIQSERYQTYCGLTAGRMSSFLKYADFCGRISEFARLSTHSLTDSVLLYRLFVKVCVCNSFV